jgi:hypothetical protein
VSRLPRDGPPRPNHEGPEPGTDKTKYIPLVENSEQQLHLTDSGGFDFHGHSSGAAFLSRITQHLPGLLRYDSRIPFLPQAQMLNSSTPAALPTLGPLPAGHANYDFSKPPHREWARILCDYAFNHASCLLRIVHVPSFYKSFDELYDTPREKHTQEHMQFLGLLYSVLALGSMYDVDETDPIIPDHYDEASNRGYKFYLGAKLYIKDLAECRDLTTLQALLFIIQFLQAIGNLNSCYNLIGIALRSALRMGLHRHILDPRMTPIESETRKRVFHTTRQMDIYLSTTLGLPIVLQSKDIDQPLPIAIDDENIRADALLQMNGSKPSINEAFNAHAKLMDILAMVVECVYPPRAAPRKSTHATYMIDCNRLREVEIKLENWYQQLPDNLRPGNNDDVQFQRAQILLRFAYAHVQMMLYRPFMQYLNHQETTHGDESDDRYQAFATAGLRICRNIISIGLEIRKQAALIGPYWFITYTQFIAVLCLTFYASSNPDKPESSDIIKDAVLGKESISGFNQKSLAADRLSAALESMFDQLPESLRSKIQSIKGNPQVQRETRSTSAEFSSRDRSTYTSSTPASTSQDHWQPPINATMQMASVSGHANLFGGQVEHASLRHTETDRTAAYHMENPIAYPAASGVELATTYTRNAREDTMQLVVPDFFGDVNGSHGLLAGAFSSQHDPSHPMSVAFQTSQAYFVEDPMARIFEDLELAGVWNMPRTRP